MAVYTGAKAMALRLIEKYGQKVIWRRIVDGPSPDPDQPWVTGSAVPTDKEVKIAFIPEKEQNRESERFSRATATSSALSDVNTGNIVGLMGNVSFVPTLKDLVIRGSEVLKIHTIEKVEPNDEGALLYKVRFQK